MPSGPTHAWMASPYLCITSRLSDVRPLELSHYNEVELVVCTMGSTAAEHGAGDEGMQSAHQFLNHGVRKIAVVSFIAD